MSTIDRVLRGDLCTGCGICAAVSAGNIEMQDSPDGFLRPRLRAGITAEMDRLIGEICPGVHLVQTSAEGVNHPLWGPLVSVRTAASTDEPLRYHASSGGALSALLLFLLESKTIDYAIEIAASEASPIKNSILKSKNRDDVYRSAGSRYAPSAPLKDLQFQLEQPGRFAVVAKPCDIAAVRALSYQNSRVAEKIPILLSFFCAGIPSLYGTREILKELGITEEDLAAFRYRGDGWPGYATASSKDGRQARMSYVDSWGRILTKHLQFRCKICPDGSGGFADIVCGDAWHCDSEGHPLFEDSEGRSLVIGRTIRGERLIRQAVAAGYLTTSQLDVSEIEQMQPSQAKRKRVVLSRLAAMMVFGRRPPRFLGLQLVRAGLTAGLWLNLRAFLGMARRLVMRRRPGSGS